METVERRRNEGLEWNDLGVIPLDQEIGPYDKELDMLMKALYRLLQGWRVLPSPWTFWEYRESVSLGNLENLDENRSEFQKERETIFPGSMNEIRSENITKNKLESVRKINRETEHCSTSSSK